MEVNMKHNQMRSFVLTALFIALILLLGLTPIGMIPLGFINISLLGVPVVIGTLFLGLKTGLILGFCFGAVSALSAFGIYGTPSALAGALVAANPMLAALMCFAPRLLIPVFTCLVYKLADHRKENAGQVTHGRAIIGTAVYLTLMILLLVRVGWYLIWYVDVAVLILAAAVYFLLMKQREAVALAAAAGSLTNTVFYLGLMLLFYVIMGINSEKVLALIGGTGLAAGTAEAIANVLITTPVIFALRKMQNN